jgi:hypothetical protein
MNDDELYSQVAQELQAKEMVPGVWTRAFAEAGGELDKARALYIKFRVAQLTESRVQRLEEQRQEALKATKQRALAQCWRFGYGLLAVVFGAVTVLAGLGAFALLFADHDVGGIGVVFVMVIIASLSALGTRKFKRLAEK